MYSLPDHDVPARVPVTVVSPLHDKEDGFTEAAVAARLQGMGYETVQTREIEAGSASCHVAVRATHHRFGARWFWAVFVHRVPHLDAATVRARQEDDRAEAAQLLAELANLPCSSLAKFVWIRIVMSIFIADKVEEDARILLSKPPDPWCGFVPLCAARDTSDGSVHYFRGWQVRGFEVLPKQQHLVGRLLLPDVTPEQEPRDNRWLVWLLLAWYGLVLILLYRDWCTYQRPFTQSVFGVHVMFVIFMLILMRACDTWVRRRWMSRRTKPAA